MTVDALYGIGLGLGILAACTLNAGGALLAGLLFSITLQRSARLRDRGLPAAARWGATAKKALPLAIVLLGSSLRFDAVLHTGLRGAASTLVTLSAVFGAGAVLGRLFGTGGNLSVLLSAGTGICGGSAIGAMGPAIGASALETGIALSAVFLLNAAALWLFPAVGHALGLSQESFGTWAALAIHDTSSVVGAASTYGPEALATATLLKLTRALWILPLALAAGTLARRRKGAQSGLKPPFPKFILGFLATSALFSFVPQAEPARPPLQALGKAGLVAALFWIGASLDLRKLRALGPRTIAHAVALWALTAGTTLLWITRS